MAIPPDSGHKDRNGVRGGISPETDKRLQQVEHEMKTFGKTILAAIAICAAAGPVLAQEGLPADFQRTMDSAVRSGAAEFSRMPLKANTTIPNLGVPAAAGRDPWRPVTQAMMSANVDYPKIRGYVYAIEATVDFDGDNIPDVARLVNNSREGGVIVTFGDKRKQPMVVFRSNRLFGSGEGLFAAGRNRLVVNIPEARQHVLYLQDGAPKVHTIGD